MYTLTRKLPSAACPDWTIILLTISHLRLPPKKVCHLLVDKRIFLCHSVSSHCSLGGVVRNKTILAPQLPKFSNVIIIQHAAGGALGTWRYSKVGSSSSTKPRISWGSYSQISQETSHLHFIMCG